MKLSEIKNLSKFRANSKPEANLILRYVIFYLDKIDYMEFMTITAMLGFSELEYLKVEIQEMLDDIQFSENDQISIWEDETKHKRVSNLLTMVLYRIQVNHEFEGTLREMVIQSELARRNLMEAEKENQKIIKILEDEWK